MNQRCELVGLERPRARSVLSPSRRRSFEGSERRQGIGIVFIMSFPDDLRIIRWQPLCCATLRGPLAL